jgi:Holliday junction resolvase
VNTKGKGARNEHRSMRLMEAAGYSCTRAAASLGVFDIVAVGSTDIALIQVKSNRWPCEIEMEDIRQFKCPPSCKKLIHRWRDRQRLPDVKEI